VAAVYQMPTQRAMPPGWVNEYPRKLGSKRAYHVMHWPCIHGLAASAGVWLRAKETEISAAQWRLGNNYFQRYLMPNRHKLLSTALSNKLLR